MHIEYQISENDFVAASKLAMRKRSKSTLFGLYLTMCIGALFVAISIIAVLAGVRWTNLVSCFILGLFWVSLPVVFYPYKFRRTYRKMFLLHGRRSIDADSDGLHFSSDSSDGHTNWQTYIKYAENDRAFLLFQQGNQIVAPIPKRELAPAQIDELRALFEAHITRK